MVRRRLLAFAQPLTRLIMYSVVAMPHALAMNSRRSMPSRRETSSAFSWTSLRISACARYPATSLRRWIWRPHSDGQTNRQLRISFLDFGATVNA